jgi:hypothetical protein
MSATAQADWVPMSQAADLIGISTERMRKLARSGQVTSLKLPGIARLISAQSARDLAKKSTRLAEAALS